mmetsp:Transcript_26431/g.71694  ORF Transcript_26431/g.71694 Transcript_26431/m.71694 type:complete len:299 (-) Transcript_26431:1243-2139(-)
MPEAVVGLHPTKLIAAVLKLVGALWLQLLPQANFHLLPVEVRAVVLHCVLDAGVLAVRAVAKVTLHRQTSLAHILGVRWLAEANDVRKPWERLLVVVREAKTAANSDVEAQELAALDDGDEANAVCEHVDVVGGRNCHSNLELSRKVGQAVERLLLNGRASKHLALLSHFFAMHKKDLVVGTCARQTMVMDGVSVAHDLLHHLPAADGRVGCAQHVAADVPASCDGVHASPVDAPHGVLHVALKHAVELPSLARSDLEGPVCIPSTNVVHCKPLLRSAIPTRQAHTDHEAEGVLNAEL